MEDIFDYEYYVDSESMVMLVEKADGEQWELEIENEYQDLGITFENGLMSDYTVSYTHLDVYKRQPQYTRPEVYQGMRVPEVLLSGHHKNIETWRRQQSIRRTLERRPDLLEAVSYTHLFAHNCEGTEQLRIKNIRRYRRWQKSR